MGREEGRRRREKEKGEFLDMGREEGRRRRECGEKGRGSREEKERRERREKGEKEGGKEVEKKKTFSESVYYHKFHLFLNRYFIVRTWNVTWNVNA